MKQRTSVAYVMLRDLATESERQGDTRLVEALHGAMELLRRYLAPIRYEPPLSNVIGLHGPQRGSRVHPGRVLGRTPTRAELQLEIEPALDAIAKLHGGELLGISEPDQDIDVGCETRRMLIDAHFDLPVRPCDDEEVSSE